MDMRCPRCGAPAILVGHEDARTFYQCEGCKRVWPVLASASVTQKSREQFRVLIADDSDSLVQLIATWLEDEGYVTMTATNGRRALDAAQVQSPDIAVLDLVMPPPDGFSVAESLLRLPSPPDIIFMTGLSDPWRVERAAEFNALTLLRKPFEQEMLMGAVRSAAHRRRERIRTLPARNLR